jgi:hypothetical protein
MNEEERDRALGIYMAMLEITHASATLSRSHPSMVDAVRFGQQMNNPSRERLFSRRLNSLIKRAKLIHIPASVYGRIYHALDVKLSEDCGIPWVRDRGRFRPSEKLINESKAVAKHTNEVMGGVPFPERLPFGSTLLMIGPPVEVRQELLFMKLGSEAARMRGVLLHAILVSDCGMCVEFMSGSDMLSNEPTIPTVFNTVQSESFDWLGYNKEHPSLDLTPGIVRDVIEHVRSFVDIRIPSKATKNLKKTWRRERKLLGVGKGTPPPDFYPYILRSTLRSEGGDGPGTIAEPMSYRTDVMAHERLLVRRGPRPIPVSKYAYYVKNGFRVFSERDLTDDIKKKIYVKGHKLKDKSEWMAVKGVWIKQHMNSNDEALPYRQKLTVVKQ